MERAVSRHLAALILTLLVACSTRDEGTTREEGTTPAEAKTPAEATTTPQAPARPDAKAHTWVATPEGVGPVKAGMLYAEAARAIGAPTDRKPSGDYPGGGCDYTRLPGMPPRVELMVFGDTIVRIDIDTVGVVTQEGFGVGSREADLRTAFRGRVRITPHPYSGPVWHYVVVDAAPNSAWRMIFETDGERVRTYRVGRRDAVELTEGCS